MSFVVSFSGQFKPYEFQEVPTKLSIASSQRINEIKAERESKEESLSNKQKFQKNQLMQSFYKQKESQFHATPKYAYQLMTYNPVFAYEGDPLNKIFDLMAKRKIRHIPIYNESDMLSGIISDRDVLKYSMNRYNDNLIALDVMSNEVISAHEKTRLQDITKIMLVEKLSCIPIVNSKNTLTGIITKTDVLDFISRYFQGTWEA